LTEKNNSSSPNNDELDAAADRLRITARLHKPPPNLSSLSPPDGQSPDPDALLAGRPLELAGENPDPADAQATQLLLLSYQQTDGWHCPRCQQVFTDPTIFAEHLIDEYSRGVAAFTSAITGKQPPPTTTPPTVDHPTPK